MSEYRKSLEQGRGGVSVSVLVITAARGGIAGSLSPCGSWHHQGTLGKSLKVPWSLVLPSVTRGLLLPSLQCWGGHLWAGYWASTWLMLIYFLLKVRACGLPGPQV